MYDNTGIGDWDILAIRYGYTQFDNDTDTSESESEKIGLQGILDDATNAGIMFLSDDDARPGGATNPDSCLWDDGADSVKQLQHEMKGNYY